METLFAVLHVVAAIFIIGPMAVLPMVGLRSLRHGDSAQVALLARATGIFGWLSLVVALLGFGLVAFVDSEDNLTYTTPWLLTSIVLYAVAITLTLSGVEPLMRKAAARLADGKLAREYRPIVALSGISALLLVAVVVLMVWRP